MGKHYWECTDPGTYDSIHTCARCGRTHCESIDDPTSGLPITGCASGIDDYAKLYVSPKMGQILVMLDDKGKGPAISYHFTPKNLGVCIFSVTFDDTDAGWDSAEESFDKVTDKLACQLVQEFLEKMK